MSYVDGPQNNVEYIDARFTMVPFKPWGFFKVKCGFIRQWEEMKLPEFNTVRW